MDVFARLIWALTHPNDVSNARVEIPVLAFIGLMSIVIVGVMLAFTQSVDRVTAKPPRPDTVQPDKPKYATLYEMYKAENPTGSFIQASREVKLEYVTRFRARG